MLRSKRPKSSRASQRSIPTRPVSIAGGVGEDDCGRGRRLDLCNRQGRSLVDACRRLRLLDRNDGQRGHGNRGPQASEGDGGDLRHAGTLTVDRRMLVIG